MQPLSLSSAPPVYVTDECEEGAGAEAWGNAQLHRWYEAFRPCTIRTEFVPLPPAFVRWLRADGPLVLPPSVTLSSTGKEANYAVGEGWEAGGPQQQQDQQDGQQEGPSGAPSSSSAAAPESFPELEAALTAAIEALGGAVCPKLNWSAPQDAAWVNGGTLRCETAGDVMLLLKSSDFAQHDLDRLQLLQQQQQQQQGNGNGNATDETAGPPVVLALRKWASFHRSMHFRCFVRGHALVAVCQRESTLHFPFLRREVPRLARLILAFFRERVQGRYPDADYVLDVYVDKRDRAWLVDVNVFGPPTDALLFSYPALWSGAGQAGTAEEEEEHEEGKETGFAQEGEDDGLSVVALGGGGADSSEDGHVLSFRVRARGQPSSSCPPFLFRIVGGGGSNSSDPADPTAAAGEGVAVAPDPLSVYRAPLDLLALGGQLDMAELMRVTMAQRAARGDGDGDGSSSSSESGDEGQGMVEEAAAE